VKVVHGDGWRGLPDEAPFDRIIVTAAPERVPEALLAQLRTGGRMVIPVGNEEQWLRVLEKTAEGVRERDLIPVRFVPMVEGPVEPPGKR
jgi:protein-L-isoaspartate(D-aspartate) O-methyltransferase